jgi:hypothetical protein
MLREFFSSYFGNKMFLFRFCLTHKKAERVQAVKEINFETLLGFQWKAWNEEDSQLTPYVGQVD